MLKNYLVVESGDTLAASASNGVLTFSGQAEGTFIPVIYKRITGVKKTAGAAGTANVKTVTVTRAASTEYALTITRTIVSETDNQPDIKSRTFYHTSTAGAASDQSIVDAFVAQINTLSTPFGVTAAATAATTFTVTSTVANPLMSIGVVKGTLAVANTTPAVVPVNKGADLITAGIEATAGINYTSYEISAEVVVPGGEDSRYQKVEQVIYVDPAVTAAVTTLDAVFNTPFARSASVKRYTAAQIAALVAADHAGGVVYQTDGTVGYYYCDGSTWALLTGEINFDELLGVGI